MKSFVVMLFIFLSVSAFAQPWRQDINQLLKTELTTSEVGIMVRDAKTGETLYEHNAYKNFTPASNMKLLTSAAALADLGANFQFQTSIHYNPKKLKNHILRGNVYFVFTGDPSLKIKTLNKMVKVLYNQGVHEIYGSVIVDNTHFMPPNHAPGWTYDSLHWAFSAPIGAVILDQNQVHLKFEPSKTIGSPVKIISGPGMSYMHLQHEINTVSYDYSMKNCSLLLHVNRRNTINLGGCWPTGSTGWRSFAIQNPALYGERVIEAKLEQNHIILKGKVKIGRTPKNIPLRIAHKSKKLKVLIVKMMKDSDNIYAESLNKTLGYVHSGRGSFLEGVDTIKEVLGKLAGIDFAQTTIRDGSGQSRYDLLTPGQISRLLYVMGHNKKLFKPYYNALPIGGVDGTLKYRLTSEDMKGNVHAKTGSMSGVSSLSGYMKTTSGRKLVFSILINHIVGKITKGRALEDQICQTLYQA